MRRPPALVPPARSVAGSLASALALAALAGCAGAATAHPAPTATVAPAPPAAKADPQLPGFVLYATDTTLVLPLDPEHPAVRLAGLWALSASDSPAVRGHLSGPCSCPTACDGARPATNGASVEVTWAASNADDDGGDDECFSTGAAQPVSLVGGALYAVGDSHNGCGGLNAYGLFGDVVQLDPALQVSRLPSSAQAWCATDAAADREAAAWPPPDPTCLQVDGAWVALDDDASGCDSCADLAGARAVHLRRGLLVHVEASMQPVGTGPVAYSFAPVTPGSCPSPADPCGDRRAFVALPAVASSLSPLGADAEDDDEVEAPRTPDLAGGDDFWIANDGRHALVLGSRASGPDTWTLWRAAATGPRMLREAPLGFPASEARILGARFHADLRPLLAGRCSALCDGRCSAASAAPSDTASHDPRDARQLGDACFRSIKAQDFDTAERECRLALARADSDRTRGAVLYNLGLIAEARRDFAAARDHYRRSLAVRPNATVRARLEALP